MAQLVVAYLDYIVGAVDSLLLLSLASFAVSGSALVASLVAARRIKKLTQTLLVDRH